MDTESEVQEVEGPGLGSRMITRRNLIKGGAIVGGTVWVAPAIESFVSRASASALHACCQCYSTTGVFIGAETDDFLDAGCAAACAGAQAGVPHGTFLRFTNVNSFTAQGDTQPQPGCHDPSGTYLVGLPGESPTTCPTSGVPTGTSCDEGTF